MYRVRRMHTDAWMKFSNHGADYCKHYYCKAETECLFVGKKMEDEIVYTIRSPWQWCLERIGDIEISSHSNAHLELININQRSPYKMRMVSHFSLLPSQSYRDNDSSINLNVSNKAKVRRAPQPCTLRFEVATIDPLNHIHHVIFASHGISRVLDGCNDKDELVRTIFYASSQNKEIIGQMCIMDHLATGLFISDGICPRSALIAFDASYAQIVETTASYFPALVNLDIHCESDEGVYAHEHHPVAVLKSPLGSRGDGVFFVSSVQDMWDIIHGHYKRALQEPSVFLDTIFQEKGRFPAWVLQREVYPPMLIRQKKFHFRSYIIVLERKHPFHATSLDVLMYSRHEVRIAYLPFDGETELNKYSQNARYRDRRSHITNGAYSDKTERILLHHVDELQAMQGKLESFLGDIFGNVLLPDMMKRSTPFTEELPSVHVLFAIAGVDVMVDVNGLFYLLEVNVNPAAPPHEVISHEFSNHLVGFMSDLIQIQLHLQNSNSPIDDNRIFTQFNFISLRSNR